jgi:hypothetical protein
MQQPLPGEVHQCQPHLAPLCLRRGEEHYANNQQLGTHHQSKYVSTQAIDQSKLAKVVNDREVHLIAYPTIKIPANNEPLFKELEALLNQMQVNGNLFRSSTSSAAGSMMNTSFSLYMKTTQPSWIRL